MASILVIDDEPAIRQIVRRILERANHRVSDACDGRAGVALVREQAFDLVITDILMPDMEGIETMREIHASHPSMPILAISGGGSMRENILFLDAASKLGADAILEKPFRAAELLQSVERLLTRPVAAHGAPLSPGDGSGNR